MFMFYVYQCMHVYIFLERNAIDRVMKHGDGMLSLTLVHLLQTLNWRQRMMMLWKWEIMMNLSFFLLVST